MAYPAFFEVDVSLVFPALKHCTFHAVPNEANFSMFNQTSTELSVFFSGSTNDITAPKQGFRHVGISSPSTLIKRSKLFEPSKLPSLFWSLLLESPKDFEQFSLNMENRPSADPIQPFSSSSIESLFIDAVSTMPILLGACASLRRLWLRNVECALDGSLFPNVREIYVTGGKFGIDGDFARLESLSMDKLVLSSSTFFTAVHLRSLSVNEVTYVHTLIESDPKFPHLREIRIGGCPSWKQRFVPRLFTGKFSAFITNAGTLHSERVLVRTTLTGNGDVSSYLTSADFRCTVVLSDEQRGICNTSVALPSFYLHIT